MVTGSAKMKYYYWLLGLIDEGNCRYYNDILNLLYDTEFYSICDNDSNREEDGLYLRYTFLNKMDDELLYLDGPCSVLEMMVALAVRIEDEIMYDPDIGDRTGKWFWIMMGNLGLTDFTDDDFDENSAGKIIKNFLDRKYCTDGKGGLFRVRKKNINMRRTEIWYQMNYFMDEFE